MLYLIYNLFIVMGLILLLPILPLLALWPRIRQGLGQRLGRLPASLRQQALIHEGSVWIHAASLGEVNAVAPVLRELLPQLPRQAVIFTCTTIAGRDQAKRLFPQATACLLLPVDLPWFLGPWIERFKPRLALIAETELWPNFLKELKRCGAQVMVVNGRLTRRSADRYRLLGGGMAEVLENIDLFAMQGEEDAARMLSLGAKTARVLVTGNTKFDQDVSVDALLEKAEDLRRDLGWKKDQPVIVAGSTRPGEEAALAKVFLTLRQELPQLRFVVAPRHLQRADEAELALKAAGLQPVRRSNWAQSKGAETVLVDSLGELKAFYALAREGGLAWIGGSFRDFGGQNPLEASALGVPTLFGPHMRHFPDVAAALLEAGASVQVAPGDLGRESLHWLRDRKARQVAAEASVLCMRSRSGASKRNAELAWKLVLVAQLKRQGRSRGRDGFDLVRDLEPSGPAWESDDSKLA